MLCTSAGCAFHHVEYPDGRLPTYVDWERDPSRWGTHYYQETYDDGR